MHISFLEFLFSLEKYPGVELLGCVVVLIFFPETPYCFLQWIPQFIFPLKSCGAPWHVESSWTEDRTCVLCTGRWVYHSQTPREVQVTVFFFSFFKNPFLIEFQLIYNIVLLSSVQQSDSVIYIHIFFRLFSTIGYYKILNIKQTMFTQGERQRG